MKLNLAYEIHEISKQGQHLKLGGQALNTTEQALNSSGQEQEDSGNPQAQRNVNQVLSQLSSQEQRIFHSMTEQEQKTLLKASTTQAKATFMGDPARELSGLLKGESVTNQQHTKGARGYTKRYLDRKFKYNNTITEQGKTVTTSAIKKGVAQKGTKAATQAATKAAATVTTSAITTATTTAATGGVGTVVTAAPKGLRKVKDAIQNKQAVTSYNIREMQKKYYEKMDKGTAGVMKVAVVLMALQGVLVGTQVIAAMITTLLVVLLPVLCIVGLITSIVGILIAVVGTLAQPTTYPGYNMVAVAEYEYADQQGVHGGYRYKDWYGMDADWCAMFLSYLAEQCDYIDQGITPKSAAVAGMRSFFEGKGEYYSKASGYEPKAGDYIFFQNGMSHVGLVIAYNADTGIITTIEGNSGGSISIPYHKGSVVGKFNYTLSTNAISGFGSPTYPAALEGAPPLSTAEGTVITIPAGLGNVHTYMGWQMITAPTSQQFKLRNDAGMQFDEEGFGKIEGRYVVATTTTFGEVGDYIDIYQEDGTIIYGIIGDIKNQNDYGANQWGHINGRSIAEFVVDKSTWYNPSHVNPGTNGFHTEWNQCKTKIINRGSFWE